MTIYPSQLSYFKEHNTNNIMMLYQIYSWNLAYESCKKSSSFRGPATKRGGTGRATKKKITLI